MNILGIFNIYYSQYCNKYQRVEYHCRGSQSGDRKAGSWRGSRLDSKADVDVAFEDDDIAVADVAFEDHDCVVGDGEMATA